MSLRCWCKKTEKLGFFLDGLARGSIIPFCWVWTPRFFFEKKIPPRRVDYLTGSALGWLPWNGQFAFRCWCALLTFAWTSKEGLHHLISQCAPTTSTPKNKKAELRATSPVTEKKKTERPRFAGFFFFSDEIFGAFDFEFFARQVSPAKSKKGAALIVQNPSTPSLD